MEGIESKTKMLAKIAAMKEELARKKKKLRKSQRVAKIKAHVQQKLKEFNVKDEDQKHHLEMCENSMFCDNEGCKESVKSVVSDDKHSNRKKSTVKQSGPYSGRARKIEEVENGLSKCWLNKYVIQKKSFTCEDECSEIPEKKIECDIESRIQSDNKALKSKYEDYINELSSDICSSKGSFQYVDNEKKLLSKEMSSQLGQSLSEDALDFESQLISSVSQTQSQMKQEEYLIHSNKNDHNLSNSQFIEILGLSQPINLTPIEKSKQVEKKMGHKVPLSLKHTTEPTNETQNCDPLDANRKGIPLGFQSGKKHLLASVGGKSCFHSNTAKDSETNSTYEYTELDAISFSQFELMEDFLSENSPLTQQESKSTEVYRKLKRPNCKPLVKRKSPRISAMSHSSDSMSSDVSGISDPHRFYKTIASKRRRLVEEKAAAVLSAFQFLMDEAKRQGGMEFHLPYTFHDLMEECKGKWNPLNGENLERKNEVKSFQICDETAGLFKSQEAQNCHVQNDSCQSSECDKPNGIEEVKRLKNNKDESLYHNQNEILKQSCVSSWSHETENKNGSVHHETYCQLQDSEIQASIDSHHKPDCLSKETESQAKSINSCYKPQSHLNETGVQASYFKKISQCCSSQCNEKYATDSSKPNEIETSIEESNSFFIPSSLCLRTIGRHQKVKMLSSNSGRRVRLKNSLKMTDKEITGNENSVAINDSFLRSQKVRHNNVLNSPYGAQATVDVENNNANSNKTLCSLRRKADQSNIFFSYHQNSYFQERRINSPKPNEIYETSVSCHKPPSSSTPISEIKSRFKSLSQKNTSTHLSEPIGCSTCIGVHDSHLPVTTNTIQDVHKGSVQVLNEIELDDTIQSVQNVLKLDVSICNREDRETLCASPLLASPISKLPEGHLSPRQILPWKKILRTPYTPLRILEGENNASSCKSLLSPTFIYGDLSKRDSLPRPIKNGCELKEKGTALYFAGCFRSCSEDSVVQLLHCEVKTEGNEMKIYLVSIQASALTIWVQDVDGQGWIPELDWRLSSDIHILEACSLAHVSKKIAIAAYGWEVNQLFGTVFVYDVCSDITNRFNLPIIDGNMSFKTLDKLHFCCVSSYHLLIGISGTAFHVIRSVVFDKCIQSMESTWLFESHRGTLIELQACADLPKACFGLTSDQKIVIWSIEIGAVLKSIQMPSAFPCLTSLLAVASVKGFLWLTVSWRIEKSDCGGIILLNPVTEQASSHCVYKIPNSGWKRLQNVRLLENCVVAISSSGSVSWWNHLAGTLIGHRKSHSATCATVMGAESILIGEVQGCVHIYSKPDHRLKC